MWNTNWKKLFYYQVKYLVGSNNFEYSYFLYRSGFALAEITLYYRVVLT